MPLKLTPKQLSEWRAAAAPVCALCGEAFTAKNPRVGDHDHTTGHVRGVLHRGCNAMLGVIENGRPRYQLTDIRRLAKMLRSVPAYLAADYSNKPLHPTHRTEDQKRELRNKRARVARAAIRKSK